LQERPLHDDQALSKCDDDTYILESITQDTNELRWWLLGFGDQVEVLEPAELRHNFRMIVQNMAKAYA